MKTVLAVAATALVLASGAALAHVASLPDGEAARPGLHMADAGSRGMGPGMHRDGTMDGRTMHGDNGHEPMMGRMHHDEDHDRGEHRGMQAGRDRSGGMMGRGGPRGDGAFEMMDGNGDGVIDREEFDAHRAQRQPS